MREYAKWLGMELKDDLDLFWIAKEGLKAPLPENWKPCKTVDTDEIYYFNFATGEPLILYTQSTTAVQGVVLLPMLGPRQIGNIRIYGIRVIYIQITCLSRGQDDIFETPQTFSLFRSLHVCYLHLVKNVSIFSPMIGYVC